MLDELGVVLGDVGHGDGRRAEVVVVGRRVAHQELGRLERAHHAVGGHAQQARARGDLVDGPLAVVDVEQREDGEAARERAHGERVGLSRALLSAVPGRSPLAPAWPSCRPPRLSPCLSPPRRMYDISVAIRRYQHLHEMQESAQTCCRCKCCPGCRSTWELVGGRRMSEQVFTNLTNCGPVSVYVNDGVVTRIRPLVADDEAEFRPWVIEADGKKYSPPKKFNLAPMVHAERRRLYSDERIKYPMKRVDFDPNGERNPQNRGKSAYERISWDEALDIVSGEITRVKKTYGSSAISGMTSSHHNWGIVGYKMGPFMRFMNCLEATPVFDNPDSWEGWHWGATHTYGFYWRLGMPEPFDNLQDVLKNTEFDRLLVERPRHHARHVLRPGVGHLAHVAQGEGHPGGLHRPLPQLHQRDLRPGQVDRAAHGHGHGAGDGDRLRVDHRGHLRQGVRRRPHHRLRRVQALRARRDRRRAQDAGVGGRGVAASRRASSARWRGSGRPSARSSRPAREAARAAPAAPPTAPSGRG